MLGIPTPAQPVAAPNAPTNPPGQTAAATPAPPPLPSAYTAVSPASLAGGENATPDKARDLRIPENTVTPASLPGTAAARGVAPNVMVGSPEPAASGSTSRLAPLPAPGAPAGQPGAAPVTGGAGMTFDQAQRLLKQYRVNWQRLSMEDGAWKFACGIPNPSNPTVNRTFTTTKALPDPVSAMREVIGQIEKNRP